MPARTRAPATSAETSATRATRRSGDARRARGAEARDDDSNEKDDRSSDGDDDDDDDAWDAVRGERDVREGMIRVRSTVPLIVSVVCVVVTALIAVCAQSWHARETALRLASVRLSATSVTLGPTTRRLSALEDAVRRLESEKASARAVDEVKATMEAERATNAANAATTTTDARVVKTEMKAELKSVLAQIDALSRRQNGFVTAAELKKSNGAFKAELAELEKKAAALEKKQANFAAKTELASLEKTTAALDKGQANFVTKAQLQKVNVANDLALSAERLRIDDAVKEAKSLRDAIDVVSKSQDVFITNTTLRRVESQIEALKKMQAKKGFFSTRPKGPVVSDEQIAMLEATVATFATHLADLEKNQADFVTTAQLQKIEGASDEIKSLQREIDVVSKKQANYVSVAQLQKLEVVTDEIKSLQSEISALAKTQDEFAILSASLKDVESKIAALADGKKKTGLLSKLSKKTDTKVTNKQLVELENAVATLEKSQTKFASLASSQISTLESTLDAISQQQSSALTAADLKSIQKAVAALEKSQESFATTAQLQKVDASREMKALEEALAEILQSQHSFANSTAVDELETKVMALEARYNEKRGGMFKRSASADTSVTNKQLKALEDAIAAVTKSQADFATVTQLKESAQALSQQQAGALTAADLKGIQKAVASLEKSRNGFATTAQLQKLEVVTDEIKSLQSEISALAKTQDEFAILSASLKDVESKIAALADGKKKTGLLSKLSKKTDTKVTNKQLKALEDAIAAVTKSQADFATVTQLKESAQALSQQQAGALTAADLKGIQKAVASLEKSQNGFATTAQLQKLEVVTDEIKSLQSEISALAKTQDEFAILSASLKDVESKIAALADGKKKTGLLSKLSKKTDTKVTNKQLKALEDAIAAVTKSQADFATVTQLKKVAAALDALKNVRDNYATTKLVKNLEDKLNQLIKTSGSVSTTPQTNLVELEQRAMERVESYIKTIPKDTSRKLTKHIEEASSLWFADRTGRQDFALASGGGRVVGHSQLSPFVGRGDGPITSMLSFLRSGVHPKSDEWLLTPSLEQPGDCIALHSSTGYVDVRLRQSVKVDAVTLEHANSLNAYDLHSAPRDVQVYGWHAREKNCKHSKPPKSLIPLGNYTYSINRGSVQTFDVVSPQTVDHVRLVVKNNQGHQKWTCLYRFRVHGVPERVEA